jgi:DGQHR domain-containing protein
MKFIVLRGENLNTQMYRGYASIADLAKVSSPDSFNQDTNPHGLQRDLSETHSRDAYRYAEGAEKVPEHNRAWSEVLLNVRDPTVVRLVALDEEHGIFELEIREELINKSLGRPQISRTDGNHRLHFGGGDSKYDWPPLTASTPFAMTIGLTPEAEAYLFMDINDNQKTMNTAHLAHLKARLTGPEKLAAEDPALWIAERLTDDSKSCWHGIVHKGGQRTQGLKRRVNLAALKTGIGMTLHDAVKLRSVDSMEGQYVLIRMFWNAVARIYAAEWADEKSMLLKGIGIWIFSQVGAEVIDRCLVRGIVAAKIEDEMAEYLRQTKLVFDWRSGGDIQGYGGRRSAQLAANKMKASMSDEDIRISQIAEAVRNMA